MNVLTLVGSFIALMIYLEYNYSIFFLLIGFLFTIFYAVSIYKLKDYSVRSKNIISLLMFIMLVTSIYLIEAYSILAILFIPTSLFTIFVLNLDYSTKQLFKNLNVENTQ